MKLTFFRRWLRAGMAAAFISALSMSAAEPKPDPAGTWSWSFTTPGGDKVQQKLKLKMEGEALTGVITAGGVDMPIQEAKLEGNVVTFRVVRERDGTKRTANYRGELKGDTITGKWTSNFGGEERTRDWNAQRQIKGTELNGNWKYSFTTSSGQTFEPVLNLKQQGEKVTGTLHFNENEAPISDGQFKDGELTFKVVRERDGTTLVSRYQAKAEEDTLKGKITSNWSGTERTYDFEAKRQN